MVILGALLKGYPEGDLEKDLEGDPEGDLEEDLEGDPEEDLEGDPEEDLEEDPEEDLEGDLEGDLVAVLEGDPKVVSVRCGREVDSMRLLCFPNSRSHCFSQSSLKEDALFFLVSQDYYASILRYCVNVPHQYPQYSLVPY